MIKRVESGENTADIGIQKYNDLKNIIKQGGRISHRDSIETTCPFCYTHPNHKKNNCINCPLYKIDQQCKNKKSAWFKLYSLLRKSDSSNEDILNAIDELITVLEKCK